jgi:hypothetical protein
MNKELTFQVRDFLSFIHKNMPYNHYTVTGICVCLIKIGSLVQVKNKPCVRICSCIYFSLAGPHGCEHLQRKENKLPFPVSVFCIYMYICV